MVQVAPRQSYRSRFRSMICSGFCLKRINFVGNFAILYTGALKLSYCIRIKFCKLVHSYSFLNLLINLTMQNLLESIPEFFQKPFIKFTQIIIVVLVSGYIISIILRMAARSLISATINNI